MEEFTCWKCEQVFPMREAHWHTADGGKKLQRPRCRRCHEASVRRSTKWVSYAESMKEQRQAKFQESSGSFENVARMIEDG